MKWSIRARLSALYSAIVVVVVVASAVVVAVVQERMSLRRLDEEIARQMLTLQAVMHTEFGKGLNLEVSAEEASGEVVAPGRVLALLRRDGELLAMWGHPIDGAWRPPVDTDVRFHTITIGSERGRLLSERVEHDGVRYVAAVVAPLADFERDMGQLRRSLLLGIVSALALAGVTGLVVGRRALRPLADMAEQARTMTEANPVARLRAPNPGDELGTFASSFNGLLDRLASVLQAQRQFMADASHELRTPVSIVRSAAQVTLARPLRSDGEYRESLTIVAEQAERLTRLVDAMFLLSRAEANGLPLMREAVYIDDLRGRDGTRPPRRRAGARRLDRDDRRRRALVRRRRPALASAAHQRDRQRDSPRPARRCRHLPAHRRCADGADCRRWAGHRRCGPETNLRPLRQAERELCRRRSRTTDRQMGGRSSWRKCDARIERANGIDVRDQAAGYRRSGWATGRGRERDGRDSRRRGDASVGRLRRRTISWCPRPVAGTG